MQGTLANGSVPSENHNNSPIIIIKSTGMKALYVEHVLNGQKLTANCTYRTERNSTQTDGDIMGSTGVITIVLLIVGIAIVLLIVGIIVWYKKYRRSADSAKSPETRTPQEMDAMISSNGVQQPGAHNVLEPTDQQNPVLLGQLMKQLCKNSILNKVILEKHF
ncbi:Hypothetical predicted protein [Pelobates cultripes]|nr:Hypothetical predicted protein [Pelobates cultripes]